MNPKAYIFSILVLSGCARYETPWALLQTPQGPIIGVCSSKTVATDRGTVTEYDPACEFIVPSKTPSEIEAWKFEARLKISAPVGIPYGREPRDWWVVGTQDRCELVRKDFREINRWTQEREVPPTEPCRGPYWFTREKK